MSVAAAALAVVLGGCAGEPAVSPPATPRDYLTAVADLLGPPGRVASLAAQQLAPEAGAPPAERDLTTVMVTARRSLTRLEELRLADRDLDAQRDALASAYPALMIRMQSVIDAVAAEDRRRLERAAAELFKSLRELPSDAARPHSS